MQIEKIDARQIIDSRGEPTVEAEVWLRNGEFGRAMVPSGASTGEHEAKELRDGGDDFAGKSVADAVNNIKTEINNRLRHFEADDQFLIDRSLIELDGTIDKSRLGANAILATSLACTHAAAKYRKIPLYKQINDIAHNPTMSLPMPMLNFLNGGKHANNSSDFQEFMVVPISAKTYFEAIKTAVEIYQVLKKNLAEKGLSTAVGDEGGFTFEVHKNSSMLDELVLATQKAGYKPGIDVVFAIDVAASEFFKDSKYELKTENTNLDAHQMIDYITRLCNDYPIVSVEDGLSQDEWSDWQKLTAQNNNIQIVGDDLLVTNSERLQKAISLSAGNAILIKPNQIGTLTETIKTIQLAKSSGWSTIVSHRSGETEDVTIAHLAVGCGAGQIKTGAVARSERNAKHNELMRIESTDPSLSLENPFMTVV